MPSITEREWRNIEANMAEGRRKRGLLWQAVADADKASSPGTGRDMLSPSQWTAFLVLLDAASFDSKLAFEVLDITPEVKAQMRVVYRIVSFLNNASRLGTLNEGSEEQPASDKPVDTAHPWRG